VVRINIRVPREISSTDNDHGGWLRFGGMPNGVRVRTPLPALDFVPQEGTLVLFSSYFCHGTLPFRAKKHRMSVGVDVISQ
jgi:hypothetical protein